jgi:hypothetical protein
MRKLAFAVALTLLLPARAQALTNEEIVSLVAMPLAVAAVSEVTGVPLDDLRDFVVTMNEAEVQPAEFVDVLRYVPVALATERNDEFIQYVRTQRDQGVAGEAFVTVVADRLRDYRNDYGFVEEPRRVRVVEVDDTYIPTVIRTVHAHPHGGPPGQLKKQLGVQTGAEVVHGFKPGHKGREKESKRDRIVIEREARPVVLVPVERGHGEHDGGPGKPHGKENGRGPGGDHGHGHGNGKGKGKG